MKPTSIIFLIVAVVLTLGGFAAMRVAEGLAAESGIELVAGADSNGDHLYSYDFTSDSIGKISINVRDAKVNIIGGAERSSIELVNFPDGMYEFSSSNRILTVSNNSDYSKLANLASMAMNFKGLRGLVNLYAINGLEKTVNIRIAADSAVKIIDCSVKTGEITVNTGDSETDYDLKLGEGSVSLTDIATGSLVRCGIEKGGLLIDGCDISTLELDLGVGDAKLVASYIRRIDAEIKEGDFDLSSRDELSYVNLDLFTASGGVKIDGSDKGGYYEELEKPTDSSYTVKVDRGSISLTSNSMRLQ